MKPKLIDKAEESDEKNKKVEEDTDKEVLLKEIVETGRNQGRFVAKIEKIVESGIKMRRENNLYDMVISQEGKRYLAYMGEGLSQKAKKIKEGKEYVVDEYYVTRVKEKQIFMIYRII